MSTVSYENYSDQDLQDPGTYYGGFKEARILRFGEAERALSQMWTGDWTGSQFSFLVSDHDRRIRQMLASASDRYWTEPIQVFMTSLANRAAQGIAYTVFTGPIVNAQPTSPLAFEITLGDIVSSRLLSDQAQLPWRVIRDGFLDQLTTIAESLDRDGPEPIIYGRHRRIPSDEPGSADGFEVAPIYLGVEDVAGTPYHVWMVCGHAVADIPDVNVITSTDDGPEYQTVIADEGTDWLIPHYSGFTLAFGAPYRDRRSSTFGNDRRYTLIYGLQGAERPDACATGERTLTCFVFGVEPFGNGSGDVILDRIQQYKHFLINYVANAGASSYQSGAWLDNPAWDLFDGPVNIVDTESFNNCTAIGEARLPEVVTSPPGDPAGYIGAAIIGATPGDRSSVRRWIADWNRSCATRFGITHFGQMRVVMLAPTAAIKAAAPLYTDAYEIRQGSFGTDVRWGEHANRIPFRADFEQSSGQWKTANIAEAGASILNYGREILSEIREYPFAPGITASYHLAYLESLIRQHPPRVITFEDTVGPNDQGDSLGYLDLGDYIRYQHFATVGAPAEIRLAQIVRQQVLVGARKVRVDAIDCEDLIGYADAPVYDSSGSPLNQTCAAALTITHPPFTPFAATYDTSGHATDTSFDVSPAVLPDDGRAYHAAWFTFTPPAAGSLLLTTVGSGYDTELAVFTGSCGALTLVQHNDNDGVLATSVLEFAVTSGVPLKILVYGHGPDDGGALSFGLYFTEPE